MGIIGLFGAVAVLLVAATWASVRLTRFYLESDEQLPTRVIPQLWSLTRLGFLTMLLYAFGPGLASWARAAWATGVSLL